MSNWFTKVKAALVEAGDDASKLDVVTLTGSMAISSSLDGKKIKLKKLFEQIEANANTNAALDVVAYTHVDLDSDSIQFIAEGPPPEALLEAHNAAVIAAQETRSGIVEMAISIFK
jgi:hypothetical protein